MAQSLTAAPAGPEPGRISQILPTIKCSTCFQPVPIAQLGEHICTAPPPMPAASAQPPMSPTSASFFQQKYQKLISGQAPNTETQPSPSPQSIQVPPRAGSVPPRQGTPLGTQRGASPAPPTSTSLSAPRRPSVAPLNVPNPRPERVPSPLARVSTPDTSKIVFPSRPESVDPASRAGPSTPAPRIPSPLSPRYHPSEPPANPANPPNRTSSEPARFMTPDPTRVPPGPTSPPGNVPPYMQPVPMRTPSAASMRSLPPGGRQPAQSTPAPPPPMNGLPLANTAPLRPRANTIRDLGPAAASPEPDVIYSTARPVVPPARTGPSRGPQLNVNVDVGPGVAGPYGQQPSIPVGGVMSPQGRTPEIDTKIGGEAGMAGVGRRGFAAAARAAMFANTMGVHGSPQSEHPPFQPPQGFGPDGRRANAPRFLDIASANQYSKSHSSPSPPFLLLFPHQRSTVLRC